VGETPRSIKTVTSAAHGMGAHQGRLSQRETVRYARFTL
jgi:hypothetical protein